jgi:hypothetical protein
MFQMTKMMSKLAVGIALLGSLAVTGATPSLARPSHAAAHDQASLATVAPFGPYTGTPQWDPYTGRVQRDDPPGSIYQDERQAESNGY